MNGMIFAAGLGTRLAPLTNNCPKALVEVGGRALLDHAICHLASEGVDNIVVNVHHFAPMICEYIDANRARWKADVVISDETGLLLETAGGLAKALPLFGNDGPIVLANADVLSNAPIGQMMSMHRLRGWDATLLTGNRHSTRNLLFADDDMLCGWVNKTKGETRVARNVEAAHSEAFNGFHIIEQRLAEQFLPVRPLSITNAYLDLAAQWKIGRMPMPRGYFWFDIGTTEKLAAAQKALFGE